MQDAEGCVKGARTTITGSGGESLLLETTSLAILAWLPHDDFLGNVEKSMKWVCSACKAGRFGSTQSTILALKAIIEYDRARSGSARPGSVTLMVDGKEIETLSFKGDENETLEFRDFSALLAPGSRTVALAMKDGFPMPYTVDVSYSAETPSDAGQCPLTLSTSLSSDSIREGETLEMTATLKNTTEKGLPMTLVVLGLPGGLEPRHDQLKESVREGRFSYYEVIGRKIALYYRDLPPNAEKHITISLEAAVPGEWRGPASYAGLYYTPEEKVWKPGCTIKISPR